MHWKWGQRRAKVSIGCELWIFLESLGQETHWGPLASPPRGKHWIGRLVPPLRKMIGQGCCALSPQAQERVRCALSPGKGRESFQRAFVLSLLGKDAGKGLCVLSLPWRRRQDWPHVPFLCWGRYGFVGSLPWRRAQDTVLCLCLFPGERHRTGSPVLSAREKGAG